MTEYTVVTDGACSGNGTKSAIGGWAALIFDGETEIQALSGGEKPSTNNRMELRAAIEGLRALPSGSRVELVTDSSYVAKAFTDNWIAGWIRRGWKKGDGKPVANAEIWRELIAEVERHEVRFTWVRGHNGHPRNERADELAVAAAARLA